MDVASLSKLNVSQLKAKFKELKLSGYSKLTKAALIEKLAELAPTTGSAASLTLAAQEETLPSITQQAPAQTSPQINVNDFQEGLRNPPPTVVQNASGSAKKTTKKRPRKDEGEGVSSKKTKEISTHKDVVQNQPITSQPQQNLAPSHNTTSRPPPSTSSTTQGVFQIPLLPARFSQPTAVLSILGTPAATPLLASSDQPTHLETTFQKASSLDFAAKKHNPPFKSTESLSARPTNTQVAKIVEPPKTKSTRPPQIYKPKTFKAPAIIKEPRIVNSPCFPPDPRPTPCLLNNQSLDFSSSPCADLSFPRITMPPSMSRRRQAERMSVVFSGTGDPSVLAVCVKVSRAWRYAVYLSATHALVRDFPGTRTSTVLSTVLEPRMTSTWSYLRARRQEVESRHQTFEQTWLGRLVQRSSNRSPIATHVWTSPDDPRQITLALRFVSTRLVFALARRYQHEDAWVDGIVVGADEVVPDEIWKVVTRKGDQLESFYVLFETGEVIGHAPPQSRHLGKMFGQRMARGPHLEVFDKPRDNKVALRTDWVKYVESIERGDAPSLQDAITSADQESYVAGVSTFWLRGLGKDDILRTIARRYVLSCVEPNSVSGTYKSVIGMTRELVGGKPVDHVSLPVKSQHVGLLVSEHHLVESVHLGHRQPKPNTRLHPALALILTAPGREYFVLRDTGMPIGTSDEGLEEVWQEAMGCDAWGRVSA